jgi:hypothetical protein
MTKKLIELITQKRERLAELQKHDAPAIEKLRKKIIADEGQLQKIKHLEAQIASAPAALKLLDDELHHYAERRQKISHRLALALGSGTSIRLKSDELQAWFLDPNLVAEIRTSVQRHLIDEPQARLREIEATLNPQP